MDTPPTPSRRHASRRAQALLVALTLAACSRPALSGAQASDPVPPVADDPPVVVLPADPSGLLDRVRLAGLTRVLVELELGTKWEQDSSFQDNAQETAAQAAQRQLILEKQDAVLQALERLPPPLRAPHHAVRRLVTTPYMALDVTLPEFVQLAQMPQLVRSVVVDVPLSPRAFAAPPPPPAPTDVSAATVRAPEAHARGCAGTGQVVVVVDTGVDDFHPLLAGRVLGGSGVGRPLADDSLGWKQGDCDAPNYGRPVDGSFGHGSQVATIISSNGHKTQGIAPGAMLVSIRVMRDDGKAHASDVAKALEEVYLHWRECCDVASVCMSLASDALHPDAASCDGDLHGAAILKSALDLQAKGIAVVSGSGNDWERTRISMPACLSPVVSVASSDRRDAFATYSNASSDLDLLAPGDGLRAFTPGTGEAVKIESGTSMAGPHVAAAFAVLRQFAPSADLTDLVAAIVESGPLVTIPSTGGKQVHRLDVQAALEILADTDVPDCVSESLPKGGG